MEKGWQEKRRARGVSIPLLYLSLEGVLLFLIVYIVDTLGIAELTAVSVLAAAAYFFGSCIPRFRRVLARQKHYLTPMQMRLEI